jgi:proline iminopeptidase
MDVAVDGVRLFFDVLSPQYVAAGPKLLRRPTVVLLHGGPGMDSSGGVRHIAAQLGDIAHVVVYDHRGNGRSGGWDDRDAWRLDRWADDVVALCAALGIEAPIVMGASFGGFVAMRYASRHPDHPAGLALLNTSARYAPEVSVEAFRRLGGEVVADIVRRDFEEGTEETSNLFVEHALPIMSRHPDALALSRDMVARTVLHQAVELHFNATEGKAMDLRPELAAVRCPTLVVSGEHDPITPPVCGEEIAAALPAHLSEYVCLAGAGHMLSLDAPAELSATLRAFIERVLSRRRLPG